nr:MAG TPA: hypothetical protein [Caudoviricetes sp.]
MFRTSKPLLPMYCVPFFEQVPVIKPSKFSLKFYLCSP